MSLIDTLLVFWGKLGPLLKAVLGFVIILGPLVFVHELGHFLFARLFNVKAEVFSIGFGPRLLSRKWGETDFRLAAIPLGGYVKLLGEDREAEMPAELADRALHRQAPWKRFFIFFGGPLFNFIFAILVFMLILVIGESQPASVIGRVLPGSPAEKVGFQSGDRVISIEGTPVHRFEQFYSKINESPNRELVVEVKHPGAEKVSKISVIPSAQKGFSQLGESTHVGDIDGLLLNPRATRVGVSDPASVAARAGLRTGDQIVSFNGAEVSTWEQFDSRFAALAVGSEAKFEVVSPQGDTVTAAAQAIPQGPRRNVTLKKVDAASPEIQWGLRSSELFVEKVLDGSPAAGMGLKAGDRLVGVGTVDVRSFYELKDEIQKSGEASGQVTLRWERDGQGMTATAKPTETEVKDPALNKSRTYAIGVTPQLVVVEPEMVVERIWNPIRLVYEGTSRMVTLTWRNFRSIGKMLTGEVSSKTLGGPILIAKIAGDSLARGLNTFLSTMALLSIGLGVLNILPVPVLDGGHILLLAVESVRRRPLSLKAMEWVQGAGLALILALMVYVFVNDFSRF